MAAYPLGKIGETHTHTHNLPQSRVMEFGVVFLAIPGMCFPVIPAFPTRDTMASEILRREHQNLQSKTHTHTQSRANNKPTKSC